MLIFTIMTIEERKKELIDQIAAIENEGLLIRMEELIAASKADIPDSIMRLLEKSSQSGNSSEHNSVREFIK